MIFENISGNYNCDYDSGTGVIDVVPESESAANEAVEKMVDSLIDKFSSLFYDEETDTFLCSDRYMENEGYSYWSPYVQKFFT